MDVVVSLGGLVVVALLILENVLMELAKGWRQRGRDEAKKPGKDT